MAERRTVRVSPSAFDQLDDQLRQERGPIGQPSVGDFVILELPAVVERSPPASMSYPRSSKERRAEGCSSHAAFSCARVSYGVLLDDDTVEILGISIDP